MRASGARILANIAPVSIGIDGPSRPRRQVKEVRSPLTPISVPATLSIGALQAGVVQDFVWSGDPTSHLYGRKVSYVELQKFPRAQSLEFLTQGFEAYGKRVPADVGQAVDRLGGTVGWLVLYGHGTVSSTGPVDVRRVVSQATKTVEAESSKIIGNSRHYRFILRALSAGDLKWKSIYEYVERSEGHVSESAFNDSLSHLVRYGVVSKNPAEGTYGIPDPIPAEYAKGL